jgi:hypothetical protein
MTAARLSLSTARPSGGLMAGSSRMRRSTPPLSVESSTLTWSERNTPAGVDGVVGRDVTPQWSGLPAYSPHSANIASAFAGSSWTR